MMSGYLLVSGLCLATVNLMLLFQVWWLLPFLLWFLSLLYFKFSKPFLSTVIVVSGIVYFLGWQVKINQLIRLPVGNVKTQAIIHPDDVQFKNNKVVGTGHLLSGENIRIFFDNQNDMIHFKSSTVKPILIQGTGVFERINVARNEFSFDPRSYWQSRGIVHRIKFKKLKILGYAKPNDFITLIKWTIHNYHYRLTNWFEGLPTGLRDYGETLLLGYTRPDFYAENGGIQLLGLMHLFSISGFQVAGIYQIWRSIARRCGVQREHSLIIVQMLLVALWLFAGGVQSLVRPILLGISQAWRELRWLTIDAKDAWGLSLIGGLLIEPGVLHNLGGQLSYLLTFGLLWLSNRPGWYQSIWLSFFILPTLLWHTFSWHPISLVANLCIVPLFTWLVIPTILIGVIASFMQVALIRDICETLINGMQYCIKCGEKIPGDLLFGRPPLMLCVIITLLTLGWLIYNKYLLSILICFSYLIVWWIPQGLPGGFVTFFDVGQGDATILRPKNNDVTIVDVGGQLQMLPNKQATVNDVTTNYQVEELAHFLKGHAINSVHRLILTHKDFDHIGNLSTFLEIIRVNNIYIPAGMEKQTAFKKMLRPHLKKGLSIKPVVVGKKISNNMLICHPITEGKGENDDSISLYIDYGHLNLMLTGDLSKSGEQKIIERFKLPKIDILKFGHHGSKTSTDDKFVNQLQPTIGIVSAGVNNRYHHPNIETLRTAKKYHVKVYNTAEKGMIKIEWGILRKYRIKSFYS